MKNANLNEKEQQVYEVCIAAAKEDGDTGCEFLSDIEVPGLSENQIKGYLSQLTQKEYIQVVEDCYFDFIVISLWEEIHEKGE